MRVLTATKGDRAKAADILGITVHGLDKRIYENSQLNAIWGRGELSNPDGPSPPQGTQAMDRKPLDLPADPDGVELAQMVAKADRELHEKGLKKLGVSKDMLKRLRGLEGLARSSGHFIAISLETTHRSYYLQVLELMETAYRLRERLMAKAGEVGYIADDEARACLNKNYVEMVKEAGRAYELMLKGAQAMVQMIVDTKGLEMPTGKKKKPGWEIKAAPKQAMPPPPD